MSTRPFTTPAEIATVMPTMVQTVLPAVMMLVQVPMMPTGVPNTTTMQVREMAVTALDHPDNRTAKDSGVPLRGRAIRCNRAARNFRFYP